MWDMIAVASAALLAAAALALAAAARRAPDRLIDQRIAANQFRYRRHMRRADHGRITEIGRREWEAIEAAQRRQQDRQVVRPKVEPIRKRA